MPYLDIRKGTDFTEKNRKMLSIIPINPTPKLRISDGNNSPKTNFVQRKSLIPTFDTTFQFSTHTKLIDYYNYIPKKLDFKDI